MKRREFILKSAGAGLLAGTSLAAGRIDKLLPNEPANPGLPFDLVAVKGGSAAAMFDKAIAAMGGMSKFVKKNQTVVVKPNIGWDSSPERAANTNPELVGRIIEHCLQAGAKSVYVFDHPVNEWTRCYKNSGIEFAVKKAGGIMVTGNSEGHYHSVQIPKGKNLKSAKVHELILESDVFINVPTLKTHGGTRLSISMKNLMGVVWNRTFYHGNNLHQCIADFTTFNKMPHLNVVDAFRVLKRNGPRGVSVADVVEMKYQIIGTDIVATDAAATRVFGIEPDQLKHIPMAVSLGSGTSDLNSLRISRITM
ncbi:MAG: DUF362 domain-containing protein [Bacteroidales bacterium]|nr:DUF362 domain-containing protein [Bacteroidales bacterium]